MSDAGEVLHELRQIKAALTGGQHIPQAARNLLARIHGDGGHYLAEHGLVKACEDAESKYCAMIYELSEQDSQIKKMHDAGLGPSWIEAATLPLAAEIKAVCDAWDYYVKHGELSIGRKINALRKAAKEAGYEL